MGAKVGETGGSSVKVRRIKEATVASEVEWFIEAAFHTII